MPTKALAGDLDFNVVLVDGPAGALRAARRNLRKPTLSPGPHDPRQGFRQRPSGTTRRPLKRGRGRPPDPPKPEKPQKPQKKRRMPARPRLNGIPPYNETRFYS